GVLTGIMSGTGMVDAMAAWLVDVIPESMGPFMAVITGLLSIPMTFFMSNDAFYFGILPVLSETAAHFGISAADMARASITGQPVHMQSPLVPAILLLVSLSGVELGDHHKKVLWRALIVALVMLAVAVAIGVIGIGSSESGMTDLYSTPHRRFPAPSLRVAASPGIDEAEATVVLALRPDASPAVCQEAIAAARRENAGLRAIVFGTDTTTAPSTPPLAECTRLGAALAAPGLVYEVQRVGSDLAEQALDLATPHAALLIVMAAKRRSPVVKLLLGSSAQ